MQKQGVGSTLRKRKTYKVLPTLDADTHHKLKRLALACDMSKTSLAAVIIRHVVNNEAYVQWLQERYRGPKEFRIIPVRHSDGRIEY
jgi:hypothetical protein